MPAKKFDITDEDLLALYDLIWGQLKEDREIILNSFKDLREVINKSPERYAVSGDTLAKFAELLTKQTGEVVELLKIIQKERDDDESLSELDISKISDEILKKNEQ
jgi:hypothetical protein